MGKFSELLKHIQEDNGKTSEDNDHYHTYEVNDEGNGKTIKTIGNVNEHVHTIEEFDIQMSKDHDHDIPKKKPKVNEEENFSMKIVKNNAIGKSGLDLAFASAKKMKGVSVPDDSIAITPNTKLKGVSKIEDLKLGMKVSGKFRQTSRGKEATELEV